MTRSTLTEGESNTPERIQIKGLLDFINRLGNASRGLGAELDQYLRKIKSASQPDSSDYHQLPALLHEASLIIQNENRKAEQQQRKMDEKVGEQLTSISDSVHNTQSLPELKRLIIHHLQLLNTAMNDRQHQENEQRKFLTAQLTAMQARLEDVENEAQNYKRRLSDQKFKSLQDSLTRLPNRTVFEERLRLEFQRWQNYATPLCVVIVDIDHFKRINDSYDHTAGDKTLQVIANTLKKSLRQTDFVCRYGGEEFVIVMPQTTTETACELLGKARHRIKSIPFKFKNTNISITMSAGVSCFVASDTPTTVFERADRALYDAKNQGRDRVRQL